MNHCCVVWQKTWTFISGKLFLTPAPCKWATWPPLLSPGFGFSSGGFEHWLFDFGLVCGVANHLDIGYQTIHPSDQPSTQQINHPSSDRPSIHQTNHPPNGSTIHPSDHLFRMKLFSLELFLEPNNLEILNFKHWQGGEKRLQWRHITFFKFTPASTPTWMSTLLPPNTIIVQT